jgi:hypothetical protein
MMKMAIPMIMALGMMKMTTSGINKNGALILHQDITAESLLSFKKIQHNVNTKCIRPSCLFLAQQFRK